MPTHKRLIIIINIALSFLFSSNLYAQNSQEIDSLKNLVNISTQDTNKIIILNDIANDYAHLENYDSAFFYKNKAVKLS